MASDECEESDTQIDTDSEFGDTEFRSPDCKIPTIIINEEKDVPSPQPTRKSEQQKRSQELQQKQQRQQQQQHKTAVDKALERVTKESTPPGGGAEKSASLTSLVDINKTASSSVSPADRLRAQLLLQRTESHEALISQKNLLLRRQYLLGQGSSLPKKSVSTADLGNKFKSFMEKISETQKMLHPAPQPSPAMQAYINKTSPVSPSPLSPLTPHRALVDADDKHARPDTETIGDKILADSKLPSETEMPNNNKNDITSSSCSQVHTGLTNLSSDIIIISDDSDKDDHNTIDFGEHNNTEGGITNTESATNTSLILIDDSSSFEENVTELGTMIAKAADAVETVNEALVWRNNQESLNAHLSAEIIDIDSSVDLDQDCIKISENRAVERVSLSTTNECLSSFAEDMAGNMSLQSVKSVPSDVDELFEMLAQDAQNEDGNYLSFTSGRDDNEDVEMQQDYPLILTSISDEKATSSVTCKNIIISDFITQNTNIVMVTTDVNREEKILRPESSLSSSDLEVSTSSSSIPLKGTATNLILETRVLTPGTEASLPLLESPMLGGSRQQISTEGGERHHQSPVLGGPRQQISAEGGERHHQSPVLGGLQQQISSEGGERHHQSPVLEGLQQQISTEGGERHQQPTVRIMPRMASIESLGDTESLSTARSKNEAPLPPSVPPPLLEDDETNAPSKPKESGKNTSNVLFEMEAIDFMDNEVDVSEQKTPNENADVEMEEHKSASNGCENNTANNPCTSIKSALATPKVTCSSNNSTNCIETEASAFDLKCNLHHSVLQNVTNKIKNTTSMPNSPVKSVLSRNTIKPLAMGESMSDPHLHSNIFHSNASIESVPSTPSKESFKEEISYQKIVDRTLDSISPLSPGDKLLDPLPVLPPSANQYSHLKDATVASPGEASSSSLSCSAAASSDKDACLTARSDAPRKRSLLKQGSSSAASLDLTETDDSKSSSAEASCSSSKKSPESLDSKENSSLSSSTNLNGRAFPGCDGSKETLLSSPELVKNVTYNSPLSTPVKNIINSSIESTTRSESSSPRTYGTYNLERSITHASIPANNNYKMERSSSTSNASTKRYEGYIPRFKDHRSPFSYTRDTLDLRKENRIASAPKVDEKTSEIPVSSNETKESLSVSASKVQDNAPALRKMEKNVLNTKKKDGDVVHQLVLSRIARKTTEKANRRGSRSTLSPLSSKENLLDGSVNSITNDFSRTTDGLINLSTNIASTKDLEKSSCSRSERNLSESKGSTYMPKFSQYSPIDIRPVRERSNTIGSITRDSKAISLSNLPATPLTHPDQFSNIVEGQRQLLKSAMSTESKDSTSVSSTPRPINDLVAGQRVDNTPMSAVISGLDLERSQARERARGIAHMKSDFDLGLSPPHVPPAIINRMKRDSESEEHTLPEKMKENIIARDDQSSRRREAAAATASPIHPIDEGSTPRELAVLSDRNKEERVRMLLAEQRSRDAAEAKLNRGDREEKIAEKLQEFRVKKDKKSTTLVHKQEDSLSGNEEKYVRKHSSRPSLLELESMQVFSKPGSSVASVVNTNTYSSLSPDASIQSCPAPNIDYSLQPTSARSSYRSAQQHEPHLRQQQQFTNSCGSFVADPPAKLYSCDSSTSSVTTPPLSTSTPVTHSPPPLTPSQISASKAAATGQQQQPETATKRKPKSKDRERRRSLIQVFAGKANY